MNPVNANELFSSFGTTKQNVDDRNDAKRNIANEDWQQKLQRITSDSCAQILEVHLTMVKAMQAMQNSQQNEP